MTGNCLCGEDMEEEEMTGRREDKETRRREEWKGRIWDEKKKWK